MGPDVQNSAIDELDMDGENDEQELVSRIQTLLFIAHEQRSSSSSSSSPSAENLSAAATLEEIPPLLSQVKQSVDREKLASELSDLNVLIQSDALVKQAEMMIASFQNAAIENPQEASAHYSAAISRVIAALSKLPGTSKQVQSLRDKADAVTAKRPPVSSGIKSFRGASRPRWVGVKSGSNEQQLPLSPPPPPAISLPLIPPKSAERTPSRTTFRRQSFGSALGLGRPTTLQPRAVSTCVTPVSSRPPSQLQVRSVSVNSHLPPPPSPATPRRKSLIPRISSGNLRADAAALLPPPLPITLEEELRRLLPPGCSIERVQGSEDEYLLLPKRIAFEPRLQIVSAQRVRVVARPEGARAWVEFGGWASSVVG